MGAISRLAQIVRGQNPARAATLPDGLEYYPSRLPTGVETQPYLTYWRGNFLPPSHILTPPNTHMVRVRSQGLTMPSFVGGSFNQNLGQVGVSSFIARMHQLWLNASTPS